MKVFILVLATIYTCNATFLSLLGGGGGSGGGGASKTTYNVITTPSHGGGGHGHGYAQAHGHGQSHAAPQVVKVILQQSQGYSQGGGGGYAYGQAANYGSAHSQPQTEYIKVIHQEAAPAAHGGYAHGHSQQIYAAGHQNYAGGHAQTGNGYSLDAILPQILQLIIQDDAGSAGGAYNNQLIAHYGNKGKALAVRNDGKHSSYFNGGHVVERGTLKVMRVEQNAGQGKAGGFGGGGHASPQQAHPPIKSGW